jgi:hypothetical protein
MDDQTKPLPLDLAKADKACKATGKRLTPKQRLLAAKALDPELNQSEAYEEVYGVTKRPDVAASITLSKPHVSEHIDALIARLAPNIADNGIRYLNELLTDPDKPDTIKLKALEMLSKWKGWSAPVKVNKQILTADLGKYKLPGTGDAE